MVTTRETRRWVIPKGWPSKRLSDRKAALREAEEEAGITGAIAKTPIGQYKYFKRYSDGFQLVSVDVYLMAVEHQLDEWPEQHERRRAWLSVKAAAAAVLEPGLREIILSLKQATRPRATGRAGKFAKSARIAKVAKSAKVSKSTRLDLPPLAQPASDKGKIDKTARRGDKNKKERAASEPEKPARPPPKRIRLKKRMLEKIRRAWA